MKSNKVKLYQLAFELFETNRNEVSTNEYNKLSYFDKVYVDRVYNNIIRQELY